ncbi:MAG: hypothetical protein LBI03_03005 [Clostridiales bacterium]|jgi:hypothetical protein|nr:hypothetical protein [Clostridiales bacterium]
MNLNKDDNLRQDIMGIKTSYSYGGIERFEKMTPETFNKLHENGFIDMDYAFNDSPTIGEFKNFVDKYPDEIIYFHGYIVSPERDDNRLVVEGLEAISENKDFIIDFTNEFHYADEFKVENGYQRCWYD